MRKVVDAYNGLQEEIENHKPSPGMMFMEMAAYVGDIMSFYLDNQIQETYLQYARQTNNTFVNVVSFVQ